MAYVSLRCEPCLLGVVLNVYQCALFHSYLYIDGAIQVDIRAIGSLVLYIDNCLNNFVWSSLVFVDFEMIQD